jgi:predicted ABC-type sugar transport system permease subunit
MFNDIKWLVVVVVVVVVVVFFNIVRKEKKEFFIFQIFFLEIAGSFYLYQYQV